jgi:hypothetical protein
MATDLTVLLEDRPGMLGAVGQALGRAGTNLAGACAVTSLGQGTVHLLVEGDPAAARSALADAGFDVVNEREVLVVDAEDQPGTLGSYAERIAEAGVNIEVMYVATGTRLVFGVDELDAAREAVG